MSEDLYDLFVTESVGRLEAIKSEDTPKANRHVARIMKMRNELWALPDDGVEILTRLVKHKNEMVRSTAALFLLPHNEKLAMKVLKKTSNASKVIDIRMSYVNVLDMWPAGQMDFLLGPD